MVTKIDLDDLHVSKPGRVSKYGDIPGAIRLALSQHVSPGRLTPLSTIIEAIRSNCQDLPRQQAHSRFNAFTNTEEFLEKYMIDYNDHGDPFVKTSTL